MKCGHTEEIFFSLVYTCKKTTSSQMRNQHKRRPSWELGVGFTEEKKKSRNLSKTKSRKIKSEH